MAQRILIVEHDETLALEMAAVLRADGFDTSILPTAADAFRALEEERPALALVRAELPEQNGFSLCARIRRTKALKRLPVILLSSDSSAEALAQHAAHPHFAADAYLQIPFAMDELRGRIRAMVGAPAEEAAAEAAPLGVEGGGGLPEGEDGVLELVDLVAEGDAAAPEPIEELGIDLDEALQEGGGEAGAAAEDDDFPKPEIPAPPQLPRRERREALTEEDKSFLERVFGSIADRKAELLAESKEGGRRSKVRRELLNTPEGKLELLREELRTKEAQIARLSEIWAIRDRDLRQSDERLHSKEVEVQGLKMEVEELQTSLAEARSLYLRKQREHGEAVDQLLLQQNLQEKELIEVVASKEREINLLRGEVYRGEDELARRAEALEELSKERDARAAERDEAIQAGIAREVELLRALAGEEVSRQLDLRHLARLREAVGRLEAERDERLALLRAWSRAERERLGLAVAARDWELRELMQRLERSEARHRDLEQEHAQAGAEWRAREAALREELLERELELADEERANEALRIQRDGLAQSLGDRLSDRDLRIRQLEEELASLQASTREREAELGAELAARIEEVGNLEGVLEDERVARFEAETELRAEVEAQRNQLAEASAQIAQAAEAAAERERSFEAITGELRQKLEERERQLSSAQALLGEARDGLDAMGRDLEAQQAELEEARRAFEERERGLQGELDAALGRGSELEEELQQAREELASVRSAVAEREAKLGAELAELRSRSVGLETELEEVRTELQLKEERWSADLAQRTEAMAELQVRLDEVQASRQREAEEAERRLVSQAETLRAREEELGRIQAALAEAEERAKDAIGQLRSREGELRLELEGARAEAGRLSAKLAESEASRQRSEEEARNAHGELTARLQALEIEGMALREELEERAEALRRLEEEKEAARREVQEARAEAARQAEAWEKARREAEEAARRTGRRLHDLEKELESATATRGQIEERHRKELEEQAARGAELKERLGAMLRERREAEARTARELELLTTRQKAELERRDQQRSLEVGRLQTALQEKTKALKVVELELARLKARIARSDPSLPRTVAPNTARRADIGGEDAPKDEERALTLDIEEVER